MGRYSKAFSIKKQFQSPNCQTCQGQSRTMKKIIFLELFLRIIEDEKWNLFEKLGQLRTPTIHWSKKIERKLKLSKSEDCAVGVLNWPNFTNRFHFSSSMILRKSSRNTIFFKVRLCPWHVWQFGDWNCFLIENALEYLPMSWAYKLEREWSL